MVTKKPFQATFSVNMPANTEGQNAGYNVPAGKRLIIEFVSFEAFVPTGQKASFSIFVQHQGEPNAIQHYLECIPNGGSGGQDLFLCGRMVRLYADPGTQVMLRTDRNAPTGTATARMTFSGYTVSVP
jgi:hypothetical protein